MQVRENNFNLLRLVFAFLVIVSHGPELIDGNRSRELLTRLFGSYSFGEFAVNSFFILSGYLITASWMSAPVWRIYLKKRVLRIAPGFLAAVLISMLVLGPWGSSGFFDAFSPIKFFAKLSVLIFDYPGFQGSHYPLVNGALWTIHYEFVCYVLLGLVGSLGWLQRRTRVVGLFASVLALYCLHVSLDPVYQSMGKSLLKTAWFVAGNHIRFFSLYLAGVLFFLYRDRIPLRADAAALATGLFAVLMLSPLTAPLAMALPWVYLLFWLGQVKLPMAGLFQKTDVSYGLYLYAWPIQQLVMQKVTTDVWAVVAWTTVLSLAAAIASWYLVEKPALGFKPRPPVQPATPRSAPHLPPHR